MIALKISALQWRGLIIAGYSSVCGRVTATVTAHSIRITTYISHLLSLLRREDELRPVEDDDGGCVLWSLEVEHCTQLSVMLCSGGSLSLSLSHLRYHECLGWLQSHFPLPAAQLTDC